MCTTDMYEWQKQKGYYYSKRLRTIKGTGIENKNFNPSETPSEIPQYMISDR